MDDRVFRIWSSRNGTEWVFDANEDAENYFWIARKARERSTIEKRYERISRTDTGEIIVTFFKGMAVQLADTHHRGNPTTTISSDWRDMRETSQESNPQ